MGWMPILNLSVMAISAFYVVAATRDAIAQMKILVERMEQKLQEHGDRLVKIETTCEITRSVAATACRLGHED